MSLLGQQGLHLGCWTNSACCCCGGVGAAGSGVVGRGPGRNWMAPAHGWRKDGQLEPPALPVLGAEAGLPPPDCPLLEDGGVSPERDLPLRRRRSLDLPPGFPPPKLEPPLREGCWGGEHRTRTAAAPQMGHHFQRRGEL